MYGTSSAACDPAEIQKVCAFTVYSSVFVMSLYVAFDAK